jgi:hypothetical protein
MAGRIAVRLRRALVIALALGGPALLAGAAAAVDLDGTWFVLMHYRDEATGKPQQLRWDDRVWKFETKGNEIVWTEYPIVVFNDDTGRFEDTGGHVARILGAWEPNAGQLAEISQGLQVNPRGTKKKTLKGSDAKGWSSGGGSSAASAGYITYTETWKIGGSPEKPVFTRVDVLGSGSADSMEGKTEYTTQSVESGGAVLQGTFERDGTRHGTFRLIRGGTTGLVAADGKTPNQKVRERIQERLREELGKPDATPEELEKLLRERGDAE